MLLHPHEAGRVVITAHPAEHDHIHGRHHQVVVTLLPGPVGFRKFDNLRPLEGLLPVLGVEPEPPNSRLPHKANRWGLRLLVVEEVYLLVEGNRGGRGMYMSYTFLPPRVLAPPVAGRLLTPSPPGHTG